MCRKAFRILGACQVSLELVQPSILLFKIGMIKAIFFLVEKKFNELNFGYLVSHQCLIVLFLLFRFQKQTKPRAESR